MENRQALDHLNATINRLAESSRAAKAWSVAVIAAVLTTGTALDDGRVLVNALYVCVAFAALDAYYLALERRFVEEYRAYSVDSSDVETAWPARSSVTLGEWKLALASTSVWLFYTVPIVMTLIALLYSIS
jgi:hypothetical protein